MSAIEDARVIAEFLDRMQKVNGLSDREIIAALEQALAWRKSRKQ